MSTLHNLKKSGACIVNAAIGDWYSEGQKRLVQSLTVTGYTGDIMTWDDWPNNNYDKTCPYNVKAAAMEEAAKREYKTLLWLDCSFWAMQSVQPIFDAINEQGFYFVTSGYNAAQGCSDKCLEYFGLSRDAAEKIPMCSSGIMGVNMNHPNSCGRDFVNMFVKAAKDGVFSGSREHDRQSADPRFLFHRQDQSAATLILHRCGMDLDDQHDRISYDRYENHDRIIFLIRRM